LECGSLLPLSHANTQFSLAEQVCHNGYWPAKAAASARQ
jgi:hypothetical protein